MLKQSYENLKCIKGWLRTGNAYIHFASVCIVLVLGDTLVTPQLFVSFSISCICEQSLTGNAYRHYSQNELSSPIAANFCPTFLA